MRLGQERGRLLEIVFAIQGAGLLSQDFGLACAQQEISIGLNDGGFPAEETFGGGGGVMLREAELDRVGAHGLVNRPGRQRVVFG